MKPDFSKQVVETVAKRAAYKCSNPDCGVTTVGPNSDEAKATVIGEAAHIFGARTDSKRYRSSMTDVDRSKITNAIWLCRNCHKLVDTDASKYAPQLLFAWREKHEANIISSLGTSTDRLNFESVTHFLANRNEFSPLARRIFIDQQPGWEWSLAAELLRTTNAPILRTLKDLREGVYVKPPSYVDTPEDASTWISRRNREAQQLIAPLAKLLARLTASFTPAGEPDADEISHTVRLIRDHLLQIVHFEEMVHFSVLPEPFANLRKLYENILGSQALKINEISDHLDAMVSLVGTDHGGTTENPLIVEKTIVVELPDGWTEAVEKEMNSIQRHYRNSLWLGNGA